MMTLLAPPLLVCRVDTRPEIGLGHLARCLSLCESWVAASGRAAVIVDDETDQIRARAGAAGVSVRAVGAGSSGSWTSVADARSTAAITAEEGADVCVVDGYRFDAAFQTELRQAGMPPLMVIDDHRSLVDYDADMVLDQNLGAETSRYQGCGADRLLVGHRYAMVRRAITDREPRSWWEHPVQSIVVTLGGSPLPQLETIVRTLAERFPQWRVDVVGPADFPPPSDRVRIHGLVPDPTELFAGADLAVSAAGSTTWELATLGVPAVLVAIADNQEAVGRAMHEAGGAVFLGSIGVLAMADVESAVSALAIDADRRKALGQAAVRLFDGRGARRVSTVLRSTMIDLRSATSDDARWLFELTNDPAVRSASFDPTPIEWDDHIRWLSARLDSPQHPTFIARFSGVDIGTVRFTPSGDGTPEIGVALRADARGRGLAGPLIVAGCDALRATGCRSTILARIRPENQPSRSAFESAGFDELTPIDDDGQIRMVAPVEPGSVVASSA